MRTSWPSFVPMLCLLACTRAIDGDATTDEATSGEEESGGESSAGSGSGGSGSGGSSGGGSATGGGESGSGASGSEGGSEAGSASETGSDSGETATAGSGGEWGDGGGGPSECETAEDCTLFEDCCSCEGIALGEDRPACLAACDLGACEAAGIVRPACRLGQCTLEKRACDQAQVTCDEGPPPCDPGTQPEIEEGCYTGSCLPSWACDVVERCADCLDHEFCVLDEGWTTTRHCEPLPEACGEKADCACAGAACVMPYGACGEIDEGLGCACPGC